LIGALRQRLFGTGQGEKVDHAQLQIQLGLAEAELTSLHSQTRDREDEQIDELVETSSKTEQAPELTRVKRYSLPEDIEERVERIIPDEVLADPERYREVGQPEVTEIIDLEPARFVRIKQVFPRYVDKADRSAAPVTAPRPPRVLLGGLASVRLLVHVILAKYLEHTPLYRQEQSFKLRCGVHISRKTMGGWIGHVAGQWLSMIYESIKNDVRSSLYLGADETPITCLDRDFGKGSRKGYLWVYVNREGDCVYEWHMGRSVKCAEGMLAGVALNPHTPVSAVSEVLHDADLFCLMSVNPGFGGQSFIPQTYEKVRQLRRMLDEAGSTAKIEIDGGVNAQNAADLKAAGADVLVAGNAVFKAPDPIGMIAQLHGA